MPLKSDSNHHQSVTLSETTCVSIYKYGTLFLPNKYLLYYFLSLWEFFSAKLKDQSLATDPELVVPLAEIETKKNFPFEDSTM